MTDHSGYDDDFDADSGDDLSVLDFSYAGDAEDAEGTPDDDTSYGYFDDYAVPETDAAAHDEAPVFEEAVVAPEPESSVSDAIADASEANDESELSFEESLVPLFTVTNPPGTVSVTALTDGRVREVELSGDMTKMTGAELAQEIMTIARLASLNARSSMRELMTNMLREEGYDNPAVRHLLGHDLQLPTTEEADEAQAQVFRERYGDQS